MIEGAFTYPTDREDWVPTVLVGGILLLLGFLVVPLFVAYGYLVRVVRETAAGTEEPPGFGDWEALLVDGLTAVVVGVVYQIPAVLVAALTVGGTVVAVLSGAGTPAPRATALAGVLLGLALSSLLSLVFAYLSVAALVAFAVEERVGAAFDPAAVRRVAFDADFAVAWVVGVVALAAAGALAGVPLLGWVLAPFLLFYATVVAARLWGGGYREATGGDGAGVGTGPAFESG